MESRTLSSAQIEELFDYCYLQSIVNYDVQVELVDHLASAIETLWEAQPQILFHDAVYLVGEQFGGHAGFVIIKQEKEAALRKKYRKLLWQMVGSFFKLPKIIVTLFFGSIIFYGLRLAENDLWITGSLVVSFFCFALYFLFFFYPKHIKIKVKEGHSFLINEISRKGVVQQTLAFSGGLISLMSHTVHFSTIGSLVFSAIVSVYIVLLYCDCFYLPVKMKEHFVAQFPQFELA